MVNKNIFLILGIFTFISISLISFSNAQIIDSELEKFISDNSSEDISVIISFREKPLPSHVQDLVAERARIGHQYRIINSVSAKVPANALKKISQKPFIEKIEPDYEVKFVLDESFYEIQASNLIKETNLTGRGIKVAVMDTGISIHDDLSVYQSIDLTGEGIDDLNGHGTHVAGIIASQNEVYSGISQGVKLYNIKTLNKEGSGYGSDIIKGIEWAIDNNLDIISLSLGAQIDKCDGTDAISRAVDKASAKGLIVVVAAGNFGPEEKTITSPGCAKEAITVGSNYGEDIAFFSSRGPTYDGRTKPELVSSGVRITSTWINNQFKTLSGTSMSTPHVTGAIALLLESNSSKDKEEILNALSSSATDLGFNENTQGAGKLDVYSAYLILSNDSGEILEEEINDSEDLVEEEISEEENKTKKTPPGLEKNLERGKNPKGFGYGFSKNLEKLNLAFTFNEDKKTELQLRFAERRLSESLSLIEEDEERSRELLEEYKSRMLDIEEELNETKENEKNSTNLGEKIIQRTLIHQEVLEEVLEKVPEQAKPAIERAINNSKKGTENALKALEKSSPEKAAEMNLIIVERNLERTREKSQENNSEEIDNLLTDSYERIKKAEELTNNLTDEKKVEILERISNNTTKQKEILEETLEKATEEKKPFVEEYIRNIENEKIKLRENLERTNQKISEKQNTNYPSTSSSNNPSQRARGITGRIIDWIFKN